MDKLNRLSWIAGLFTLSCLIAAPSQAQVTSDGTLSTEVTTLDNRNFVITGDSQAGGNLFHSFNQFSIPSGGSAFFNNNTDVVNIIGRVTGGSISEIDGLIRARGNANLFLINPNGIIFGPNAQLSIGGSFITSTANRLNFANGDVFSATDLQAPPLLTVSVPNGLQLGRAAGSIINRSSVKDIDGISVGLQVQPDRTLALVGSEVIVEDGSLTAIGGRIDVGSVFGDSLVSLTPIAAGWSLGYEDVQNFQDIRLSQAGINVGATSPLSDSTSGNIQLQGKQINISQETFVGGVNSSAETGGNLEIRGSESVEVDGSNLANVTFGSGAAGNIIIETKKLLLSNGSSLDTQTNSDGQAGTIAINASESVELKGNGMLTQIASQASKDSSGDAGRIEVQTNRLILSDGGQIASSTFSAGNGGEITVNAAEFVVISGQGEIQNNDGNTTPVASGVFARTRGSATGNGGVLRIDTGRLIVEKGGTITVAATDNSTGQAGTLDINAVDSVEVSGTGSSLQASSASPQRAGNLTINTDKFVIQDGAKVSVSSTGTGDAGNLQVQARTISLDDGKITATSLSGLGQGNISLEKVNSLLLRDGSVISTNAEGAGNGGNIEIKTDLLTALEGSKITANANGTGNGGRISIKTQGLFLSRDSEIRATSERGVDGVVEINRLENEPESALLTLPAEPVNISGLIAQGCSSGGGSMARNSKFVVTGRGGLPPTPKEAFRGDVALADLGKPIEIEATRAKVIAPNNQKPPELTPLLEAQGWVIGSKGEVILTASASNVTPSIPWMKSSSCHG